MSESVQITCPNCGANPRRTIPVWEDVESSERNDPPDYVGCTECHTMTRYVKMDFKLHEDFECTNCGFIEEDIVYEERPDYCPNCGETNPWRPTHD